MQHSQAVSILDAMVKDSKIFQGILVAQDCVPINDRRVKLAKFLISIADALVDVPHQTDLFKDAPKGEDPGKLVECPACHHQQADGGVGSFCIECGVGPMPTKYPLTAKSCLQALNAVLDEDEQLELETVEKWSAAELTDAIIWAKAKAEVNEDDLEIPEAPLHIMLHLPGFEFDNEDVTDALGKLNLADPLPDLSQYSWFTQAARIEVIDWALRQARSATRIAMPEVLASNVAEAHRLAEQAKLDAEDGKAPEQASTEAATA